MDLLMVKMVIDELFLFLYWIVVKFILMEIIRVCFNFILKLGIKNEIIYFWSVFIILTGFKFY